MTGLGKIENDTSVKGIVVFMSTCKKCTLKLAVGLQMIVKARWNLSCHYESIALMV